MVVAAALASISTSDVAAGSSSRLAGGTSEGNGTLRCDSGPRFTMLSAKAAGRVGAIHVLEGEQVQAGEIVVELELAEVEA